MPINKTNITINDIVYVVSNLHYTKNKVFPVSSACLNNRQALVQVTEHLLLLLNINQFNIVEVIIKECDYIDKLNTVCFTFSYLTDSGEINIDNIKTVYDRILRHWV